MCLVQLGEVKRDFESAAKQRQDEHSATVARLEASHVSSVAGMLLVMQLTARSFVIRQRDFLYAETSHALKEATFTCRVDSRPVFRSLPEPTR